MKREAKLLLKKACDALVLSIKLFNRPYDRARVTSTLIQFDHGLEMLIKATILHRGGNILDKKHVDYYKEVHVWKDKSQTVLL